MTRAFLFRVARQVAIVHAFLVGGLLVFTWNSPWSEIGPAWYFVYFLDYPAAFVVILTLQLIGSATLESMHSLWFALPVLALGTIQWIAIVIGGIWINHVVRTGFTPPATPWRDESG